MSDAPPSQLPGQEQPAGSRSSRAGSSPSTASAVPPLARSQSWPAPLRLPPASSYWHQQPQAALLAGQTLPLPLQGGVVESQVRPGQSPPCAGSQRSLQLLPPLTSEYVGVTSLARPHSLPPVPSFGESHQHLHIMMPTPYQSHMQPTSRSTLSEEANRPPSLSSLSSTSAAPASQTTRQVSARGTRRSRANVIAACSNCKKAHLACDVGRPCQRCIHLRKEVRLSRYTLSLKHIQQGKNVWLTKKNRTLVSTSAPRSADDQEFMTIPVLLSGRLPSPRPRLPHRLPHHQVRIIRSRWHTHGATSHSTFGCRRTRQRRVRPYRRPFRDRNTPLIIHIVYPHFLRCKPYNNPTRYRRSQGLRDMVHLTNYTSSRGPLGSCRLCKCRTSCGLALRCLAHSPRYCHAIRSEISKFYKRWEGWAVLTCTMR
ncbi:hypothetical protein V1525DRAFT_408245 [Lipomyces kononenkoae]|uniref:Uncharacterized protein n=1 Tax=Lipomyces kononenkoae TaxID=34357 RepID=A0ACC3SX34_LIPKO